MVYFIKRKYRYYKQRIREFELSVKEYNAGAKKTPKEIETDFKSKMLLQVHRVEKGLGLEDCEPGHSASIASDLEYRLLRYIDFGYDVHDYTFEETFAVLHAYLTYQEKWGEPKWEPMGSLKRSYDKIVNLIGVEHAKWIVDKYKAGSYELSEFELKVGCNFDFDKFIASRHSMRMFSNRKISEQDMQRIAEISNKAPSACNRQPARLYFVQDAEKLKMVDRLITGNHGFEGKIPYYVILTEDRAQFAGEEQFQWYINGGIYLAYLTLAMHSQGIGSCIMQWKAFHKNEAKLKNVLGVTGSESIIAIIGCGYYKDKSRAICAMRKSAKDTLAIL